MTADAAVLIFTPSFALPVKARTSLSRLDSSKGFAQCKSGFQMGITRRDFFWLEGVRVFI